MHETTTTVIDIAEDPLASKESLPQVLFEIAAVGCIGFFPKLLDSITSSVVFRNMPFGVFLGLGGVMSMCVIVPVLFILSRGNRSLSEFGLDKPSYVRDIQKGIILLLVSMLALLPLGYLALLFPALGENAHNFNVPSEFNWLVFLYYVPLVFIAAFSEELVMRGYLITRLRGLLKSGVASVLISALIFTSYHLYQGPAAALFVFVLGVVWGASFVRMGRIWPIVVCHTIFNLLAFGWAF